MTDDLHEALRRASANPSDVWAQIEAAYACDRIGDEELAIRYYDAAWRLGIPADERLDFLVGYGSTLRNLGRADEAVTLLGEATAAYGDYAPLKTFLALALFSAGHPRAAMATMLDVILDLAEGSDALDGYERALAHYHQELLDAELSSAAKRS